MTVKMRSLSDKGSGMYYVMIILLVISVLFSVIAYLSLGTAVTTINSISENSDYIECDSALNKVLGTLRVYFIGASASSLSGTDQQDYLFSIKGIEAKEYYYPISGTDYHIEKILEQPQDEQAIINGNDMGNGKLGFEAEYQLADGQSGKIVIKDVTARKGSVSVVTDIVLKVESDKIKEIVFENYNSTILSGESVSTGENEGGDGS